MMGVYLCGFCSGAKLLRLNSKLRRCPCLYLTWGRKNCQCRFAYPSRLLLLLSCNSCQTLSNECRDTDFPMASPREFTCSLRLRENGAVQVSAAVCRTEAVPAASRPLGSVELHCDGAAEKCSMDNFQKAAARLVWCRRRDREPCLIVLPPGAGSVGTRPPLCNCCPHARPEWQLPNTVTWQAITLSPHANANLSFSLLFLCLFTSLSPTHTNTCSPRCLCIVCLP